MRATIEYCCSAQERKTFDLKIEIVALLIKGGVMLTVPPDRETIAQEGSRGVALCHVFHLKLRSIHLTQSALKVCISN